MVYPHETSYHTASGDIDVGAKEGKRLSIKGGFRHIGKSRGIKTRI